MPNDERTPICPMMSIASQLSEAVTHDDLANIMMGLPIGLFLQPKKEKPEGKFHPCIGSRCALWHTNKMQSNIGRCNLNPEMSQYKDPALISTDK